MIGSSTRVVVFYVFSLMRNPCKPIGQNRLHYPHCLIIRSEKLAMKKNVSRENVCKRGIRCIDGGKEHASVMKDLH